MIYTVFWVSQVEAENPIDAAEQALTNVDNGVWGVDVMKGILNYNDYDPTYSEYVQLYDQSEDDD
jgi:hypothetical protein